jgi:acetyl-CoA C-acetyltransferase
MTTVDPHAPCIVGVGQLVVRADDDSIEPLEMWERIARIAASDALPGGPARVLDALDRLHVVFCQTWDYDDPAGRLAGRLGITPRDRRYSGIGGTVPQVLVADAAAAIGRGHLSSALICMGEGGATMRSAMKAGGPPRWSHRSPVPTRFPFEAPTHPGEKAHGVQQAWLTFAMRDVARRAARGESPDAYRADMAEAMSGLTKVASDNPYAWFPIERSASDLGDARPDNRYVGYPYTKLLCSFLDVDQAAAIVMMSHAEADRLGVAADQRVYLHATAYDEDAVYVAEHPDLGRSPAMARAAAAALSAAGVGIDDVAHLDL